MTGNSFVGKRTFKNCQRCSKEFHAKSSTAKYCMDCRVDVMDERARKHQKKRYAKLCHLCQEPFIGEKLVTENEEGGLEVYCKPCYRKLVFN